jgi:hypothetical protein
MIFLMTGRINVVFKFWNQVGLCGILKLIDLIFGKDTDYLAQKILVFANAYEVKVKQQANQSFLKCDCLHYERCGIPCTHIMKIINQIDETIMGPRGAPRTCNQLGASRSYSFGQI